MIRIGNNATVAQRVQVAPGLIILRVIPDQLPYAFTPGQYTVLGLPASAPRVPEAVAEEAAAAPLAGGAAPESERWIRRAYSIASSSDGRQFVEFYLALIPSGELTPRLFALQIRDRLHLGLKPTGFFTLDRVPDGRDVLLVATGTGLAPYMSMLRSQLAGSGARRYLVLHGARYSWDLGYRSELESMARLSQRLIYMPVVSRPDEDLRWQGLTGRLQDVLFSGDVVERVLPLVPERTHVFLCGNPGMVDTAKAGLVARGYVADQGKTVGSLHLEEYW